MKSRHLLPLAFLFTAFSVAARAQLAEVYGTVNFTHISNIETGAISTSTTSTEQFASNTPVGVGGGVTFNFLPLPVVKLGVDLRGSTRPGTVGADTALGGIKLTVKPPFFKPKFFIEGAAGYLATRTVNVSTGLAVNTTFGNQYAIYQVIGGVDYPLVHFVDFRVEAAGGRSFGNGTIYNSTATSIGGVTTTSSTNANVSLFTVNTGFVLHF